MKGLVLLEPGRLKMVDVDATRPRSGEVLIEVDNIGLCGSDLHLYRGTYNGPHRYPMYFGHEWAGRVVEDGGGEGGFFAPGDLVTGDCSLFCSECDMCQKDKNLCAHIEKFGITVDGASRRLITVKKRHVYKAPAGVRVDLLSLAEPLAVAARAVGRAAELIGAASGVGSVGSMPGCEALVLGAGPIGLGAVLALKRLHGVAAVYGDDIVETRRRAISLVGGVPVAQSGADAKGDYSSLYSNTRWDLVVETTGAPAAVARALSEVKPRGIVVFLGFLPRAEYELRLITVKSLTVVGSIGGTGNFEDAIKLIAEHPDEVETLVGKQFGHGDALAAFELGLERSVAGKVQIRFAD